MNFGGSASAIKGDNPSYSVQSDLEESVHFTSNAVHTLSEKLIQGNSSIRIINSVMLLSAGSWDSLKRAIRKQNELQLFDDMVQQAYHTRWVVNCEPSLAGSEHVVKYPGQYTHRVAITKQRILNTAGGKVTFIAKDYRDGAIKKPVTLDGVEFLRRFTMHILPGRFVKIRRYGIYNHTVKRNLDLLFIPEQRPDIDALIKRKELPETNLQRFKRITGIDPGRCPVCKKGTMVTVRELPRIRSPAWRQTFQRSAI